MNTENIVWSGIGVLLCGLILECSAAPLAGSGEVEPLAYFSSNFDGASVTAQSPHELVFLRDGSGQFLIMRGNGIITLHDAEGNRENPDNLLLNIERNVRVSGEAGMFSLVFDPDFSENRFFYLSYLAKDGMFRVSRFRWEAGAKELAPGDEESLFEFQFLAPGGRHFGGQLAFGPDGYLYVGVGDGGLAPAQDHPSQMLDDLRGKILRIDVHATTGDDEVKYAVPVDNPFVGREGTRPEIWAYGLRNPWRFDFDSMTGDLFLPDLGEETQEEINFQAADAGGGQNYGWPYFEGKESILPDVPDDLELTEPVLVYGEELGSAVIGGFVFRHPSVAQLEGAYVFGDFVSRRIFAFKRNGADWSIGEIFGPQLEFSDLALSPSGELICADAGNGVSRAQSSIAPLAPVFSSRSRPPGPLDREIQFSSRDFDPRLTYRYTFDGSDPDETSKELMDRSVGISLPEIPAFTFKIRAFPPVGAAPGLILGGTFEVTTRVLTLQRDSETATEAPLVPWPSDAAIHYTLDGSDPDVFSPVLATGEGIPLDSFETVRVRAVALHPKFTNEQVREFEFTRDVPRVTSFADQRGFMRPGQELALSSSFAGATIRYTLDDSAPTAESNEYTGAFIPPPGVYVRTKAFVDGFASSESGHGGDLIDPIPVRAVNRIAGVLESETAAASRFQAPALAMRLEPQAAQGDANRLFVVSPALYEIRNGLARLIASGTYGDVVPLTDANLLIATLPFSHQVAFFDLETLALLQTLGSSEEPANSDGEAEVATFLAPSHMAPDGEGGVFVVCASERPNSGVLRRILPDRSVVTVAGNGTIPFADTPLPADEAYFSEINAIAVASESGVVYFLDRESGILKLEDGMVAKLNFGQLSQSRYAIDGPPESATFRGISGIDVDRDGKVYFFGAKLRRFDPLSRIVKTIEHGLVEPLTDVHANSSGEIFITTASSVFQVELADSDDDRIPDFLEPRDSAGINDLLTDDDGDGSANAVTILFKNGNDDLRTAIFSVPGSDRVSVVFPRDNGKRYRVEQSIDIVNWSPVPDSAPRVDGPGIEVVDVFTNQEQRPTFLRIIEF